MPTSIIDEKQNSHSFFFKSDSPEICENALRLYNVLKISANQSEINEDLYDKRHKLRTYNAKAFSVKNNINDDDDDDDKNFNDSKAIVKVDDHNVFNNNIETNVEFRHESASIELIQRLQFVQLIGETRMLHINVDLNRIKFSLMHFYKHVRTHEVHEIDFMTFYSSDFRNMEEQVAEMHYQIYYFLDKIETKVFIGDARELLVAISVGGLIRRVSKEIIILDRHHPTLFFNKEIQGQNLYKIFHEQIIRRIPYHIPIRLISIFGTSVSNYVGMCWSETEEFDNTSERVDMNLDATTGPVVLKLKKRGHQDYLQYYNFSYFGAPPNMIEWKCVEPYITDLERKIFMQNHYAIDNVFECIATASHLPILLRYFISNNDIYRDFNSGLDENEIEYDLIPIDIEAFQSFLVEEDTYDIFPVPLFKQISGAIAKYANFILSRGAFLSALAFVASTESYFHERIEMRTPVGERPIVHIALHDSFYEDAPFFYRKLEDNIVAMTRFFWKSRREDQEKPLIRFIRNEDSEIIGNCALTIFLLNINPR